MKRLVYELVVLKVFYATRGWFNCFQSFGASCILLCEILSIGAEDHVSQPST